LHAQIKKAVADPSVKERITKDAGIPMDTPLGEIEPMVKAEIVKWSDVVKRANIAVQ
jgi:tripartite-type tricarboxylate transporter receptor subunit TctC